MTEATVTLVRGGSLRLKINRGMPRGAIPFGLEPLHEARQPVFGETFLALCFFLSSGNEAIGAPSLARGQASGQPGRGTPSKGGALGTDNDVALGRSCCTFTGKLQVSRMRDGRLKGRRRKVSGSEVRFAVRLLLNGRQLLTASKPPHR